MGKNSTNVIKYANYGKKMRENRLTSKSEKMKWLLNKSS